jgi:hypothetical protein
MWSSEGGSSHLGYRRTYRPRRESELARSPHIKYWQVQAHAWTPLPAELLQRFTSYILGQASDGPAVL